MSDTTETRLTEFAGLIPARGTYPIAADTKILKGTQVGLDASEQAVAGALIAAGCLVVVGKASATYDNTGGIAGALDVEVEYGVFEWENSGGGDEILATGVAYAVDNQTVADNDATGTRCVAGYTVEVRSGVPWVYMGPHVAGLI